MPYSTSGAPVLVTEAGAGETPGYEWFQDLAATLNTAHAFNTCHPINQGWPDGGLDSAGLPSSGLACVWRIPVLGSAFTSIAIEVEGQASLGNGGVVLFQCGNASLQLAFAGAKQRQSGTLTVPATGNYHEIEMYISASSGNGVRLYGINSAYPQIGSAGLDGSRDSRPGASAVHPLPSESFFDGQSLSSYFAHAFRSSIAAMTGRPRSLVTWSGVPSYAMQAWPQRHLAVPGCNRGWIVRNPLGQSGTFGESYTVYLRAHAPNTATDVWVQIVDAENAQDGVLLKSYRVHVPQSATPVWRNVVIELPETGRVPSKVSPQSVHAFTSVSIHHADSVEVLSFSLWGE